MKPSIAAALAALVLFGERAAEACSICGCGDPLVDVTDSMPIATPLRLALDFEALTADAASDEDPAAKESVTQVTLRPVVVWSPTESLNFVAQIPLVRKDWKLTGDEMEQATNTGLGDLDLGARWFFWSDRSFANMSRQSLGLSGGVTMPTGADDATEDGARIDDHAQLGTGSWGPYLGLNYAYHRDPWNFFGGVTGQMHSRNSYGYRYGSAVRWATRVDYRIVDRFALAFGIDGRYAGHDDVDDEEQVNTGGFLLAATPGAAVNLFSDVWLRGRVQLPFITSLNGDQSVGPTFFASVEMLIR